MAPVIVSAAYCDGARTQDSVNGWARAAGRATDPRHRARGAYYDGTRGTCESEILSVGRSSSMSEAPDMASFETGGHGWIVNGPAGPETYDGPYGATTLRSVGAANT